MVHVGRLADGGGGSAEAQGRGDGPTFNAQPATSTMGGFTEGGSGAMILACGSYMYLFG